MTTTLKKACVIGMAGIMTIGLGACGNKSDSSSNAAGSDSAASTSTTTLKQVSKDDFTKTFSDKKVGGQKFSVIDSSQVGSQIDRLNQAVSQLKISPASCDTVFKQISAGVTKDEVSNVLVAAGGDESKPVAVTFNTKLTDRQKKTYQSQDEQIAKCGKMTMSGQGQTMNVNVKTSPLKGYENISKQASLIDTTSSMGKSDQQHNYQAYVWLTDDQLIRASASDAKTAESTLKSTVDALKIVQG